MTFVQPCGLATGLCLLALKFPICSFTMGPRVSRDVYSMEIGRCKVSMNSKRTGTEASGVLQDHER